MKIGPFLSILSIVIYVWDHYVVSWAHNLYISSKGLTLLTVSLVVIRNNLKGNRTASVEINVIPGNNIL